MEEDVRMLLLYILYIYIKRKPDREDGYRSGEQKEGGRDWYDRNRVGKGGRAGATGKSDEAGRRKRRHEGGYGGEEREEEMYTDVSRIAVYNA